MDAHAAMGSGAAHARRCTVSGTRSANPDSGLKHGCAPSIFSSEHPASAYAQLAFSGVPSVFALWYWGYARLAIAMAVAVVAVAVVHQIRSRK